MKRSPDLQRAGESHRRQAWAYACTDFRAADAAARDVGSRAAAARYAFDRGLS